MLFKRDSTHGSERKQVTNIATIILEVPVQAYYAVVINSKYNIKSGVFVTTACMQYNDILILIYVGPIEKEFMSFRLCRSSLCTYVCAGFFSFVYPSSLFQLFRFICLHLCLLLCLVYIKSINFPFTFIITIDDLLRFFERF
jgi:hypothetical protein